MASDLDLMHTIVAQTELFLRNLKKRRDRVLQDPDCTVYEADWAIEDVHSFVNSIYRLLAFEDPKNSCSELACILLDLASEILQGDSDGTL